MPAYREFVADAPCLLSIALERKARDRGALTEGRVFVDGKRATEDHMLAVGQSVRIGTPVPVEAIYQLLHMDTDLVVVNKASGVSSIPDVRGRDTSLLGALEEVYGKLHATSRLDREVSGVVIFARTEHAREALVAARASRTYRRHYVALSHARMVPEREYVWNARIGRAKNPHLRQVDGKDATDAETLARMCSVHQGAALWHLAPQTGRTHQLRLHASHAGFPLLGDTAYGGKRTLLLPSGQVLSIPRIMLHAARVSVPTGTFEAPIPEAMATLWGALGGPGEAWDIRNEFSTM